MHRKYTRINFSDSRRGVLVIPVTISLSEQLDLTEEVLFQLIDGMLSAVLNESPLNEAVLGG